MITYELIREEDYKRLTCIMKAAFDDDTRMHTSLSEDGPCGYDDGTLVRKLNMAEHCISEKILLDGQIIGAYTVRFERNKYTLEMLYLNPEIKGKGIGYEVWRYLEKTYSKAEEWIVETPEYSKRNYYFYVDKCGFRPVAIRTHEGGGRSVIFEKKVPEYASYDRL